MEKVNTLCRQDGHIDRRHAAARLRPSTRGWDETKLLGLAASLEQQSEHPIATPVVQGAKERGIRLSNISTFSQSPVRAYKRVDVVCNFGIHMLDELRPA